MTRLPFSVSLFCLGLFTYVHAYAQEATITTTQKVIERPVIVTAVPAPKENIATPAGFANCFTVAAGWYQNIWVAKHSVCQYANSTQGVAWIEGYWTCTKYDATQGHCITWEWKSPRWEKTLTVY